MNHTGGSTVASEKRKKLVLIEGQPVWRHINNQTMSHFSYTIHQHTLSLKVFWGQNITTNASTCTQTCHSWSKDSLLHFTSPEHEDPPSIWVNRCMLASSNWKWGHISKPGRATPNVGCGYSSSTLSSSMSLSAFAVLATSSKLSTELLLWHCRELTGCEWDLLISFHPFVHHDINLNFTAAAG